MSPQVPDLDGQSTPELSASSDLVRPYGCPCVPSLLWVASSTLGVGILRISRSTDTNLYISNT